MCYFIARPEREAGPSPLGGDVEFSNGIRRASPRSASLSVIRGGRGWPCKHGTCAPHLPFCRTDRCCIFYSSPCTPRWSEPGLDHRAASGGVAERLRPE